jgi:hypothetical protein
MKVFIRDDFSGDWRASWPVKVIRNKAVEKQEAIHMIQIFFNQEAQW